LSGRDRVVFWQVHQAPRFLLRELLFDLNQSRLASHAGLLENGSIGVSVGLDDLKTTLYYVVF